MIHHLSLLAVLATTVAPCTVPGRAEVKFVNKGMLFPVRVEVDLGTKTEKQFFYTGGEKTETVLWEKKHTFETRNSRFDFPQPARYILEDLLGKEIWRSEVTVDPRVIDIGVGTILKIEIHPPLEPYNGKFFALNGIPCAINFSRPYWFQDVEGEWKGSGDYPNSLFYLVDEEKWGPERVFENLAAHTLKQMKEREGKSGESYRADCNVSFMCALTPGQKVPEAIMQLSQAELKAALLEVYNGWLREKCYRTWQGGQIQELKKGGYLPADYSVSNRHMSVAEGLELAKGELRKWKERNKK